MGLAQNYQNLLFINGVYISQYSNSVCSPAAIQIRALTWCIQQEITSSWAMLILPRKLRCTNV